jgi:hydroxypyruvate isomerase
MLRFSANLSLLFSEYPFFERFALAKQHGFTAVEIQFPYTYPAEQIQAALAENQLKLVLFNVDAATLLQGGEGLAAVPDKQAEFKAAVAQTLQYAKVLRPNAINVLAGCCHNPAYLATYQTTFKQNLAYATETFASININTVFEAINYYDLPGFIVNNSSQMLEIWAEIKHPRLGLQYDIYHMTRMGENCTHFLQNHLDKISHIQFADCPGRGEPGSGMIDFTELFNLLADSAYPGWVGAEYKPVHNSASSFAWLERLVQPVTV